MMSRRERNLLIILIILIFACFFFFTFQNSILEIKQSKKSIENYTQRIEIVRSKKQNSNKKIEEEKSIVFEQKSASELADEILYDLKKSGITPLKYQISKEYNGEYIEISITCNNMQIANYFKQQKDTVYPYMISNINIKNDNEKLNGSLRYLLIPSEVKNLIEPEKLMPIEKLFRPVYKKTITHQSQTPVIKKEPEPTLINSDYSAIGKIKEDDGIEYLYIKNTKNNKVVKIPPENILSIEENQYIVKIDNENYLINKE